LQKLRYVQYVVSQVLWTMIPR